MTLSIIKKAEELSKSKTQIRKEQRRSKNEILYERQMWRILDSKKSGIQKIEELGRLAKIANDTEIQKSIELIRRIVSGLYDVETLEKVMEPAQRLQKALSHQDNRL